MAKTISMIRGTTNMLKITVTDAAGNLYTMGNGAFIKFGVKKKPEDEECLIYKEINTGYEGVHTVTLLPDDTIDLDYGRYVYDVGLQSGDHYFNIIPSNAFVVLPNVTEWGVAE